MPRAHYRPMWIFTTLGFFSVVAHRDKPKHLCVRARSKADIIALRIALGKPRPHILETPEADYRYRMIVPRKRFAEWLSDHVEESLNYGNFKNRIYKQEPERARLYHDVWATMRTITQ